MNRRDVMKGFAMLALARVGAAQGVSACSNGAACTPATKSLLVWLEGPFALVLWRANNKITGVTAFSPVDPDHLMNMTSGLQGNYPFQFHFTLNKAGLVSSSFACVSSDFNDFCEQKLGMVGNPDNSFVRVLLPCPKNIYTSKLLKGTLGTGRGRRNVCIPQDHVLEYEIANETPITLLYEEKNQLLQPSSNLFHIEVGLPKTPGDPHGTYAKHHHNKSILGYFPLLQADPNRQLTSIVAQTCRGNIPEQIANRLKPFASTLECKTGGLIGGDS